MLHEEITNVILKAFYKVHNSLGYGFLEKIYENALLIEMRNNGLKAEQQKPVKVYYEGNIVGDYFADIVVNDVVILELKSAESIRKEHIAQLTNYLKATGVEVGLLLNFGSSAEFKRIIFTPNRFKNP